jgi:predicted AAA+ superfamily ATPase
MRPHGPTWSPKPSDYQQIFQEQNPWWQEGRVPTALASAVERPLARCLYRRLLHDVPRRFQLILGPRRVGKTTVMYQTVQHLVDTGCQPRRLLWLRLDHPLLMLQPLGELVRAAIKESAATVESPLYLFLDELTYAADWDLWLKTFYDEAWPVRVTGTSSSTAALRNRQVESGVGRWEEQYLAPYLFGEFLELAGHPVSVPVETSLARTLEAATRAVPADATLAGLRRRFLLTGGFPEILLGSASQGDEESALLQSQRILRSDAVERAIYKDIPQAFGLESPMLLERLLYTLAGQVTGVLSPTTLSQTLDGMSQPTVDRYLAYLERAFLVFTVPNYSGSEASRQRRGRKLYFVDSAVRNAALQRGIAPLHDAAELGVLTENLVAGHLHALSQQSAVRLYHWRDRNDEVDLIYDHPEEPLALEIGLSHTHHRSGLQRFMERFPRFRGRCYVAAPNAPARLARDAHDHIGTIPLDVLLLAVSAQTARELDRRVGAPAAAPPSSSST